jgi:hypothetical protein
MTYSPCPEGVSIAGVDGCPPSWAVNPEFQGEESYFGGAPPLPVSVGYVVVLGFGLFFSIFTTIVVYVDKAFSANATITSEQFK